MVHSGKESESFMAKVVYSHLGRNSNKTVLAPGRGLDNGVVSLEEGNVMVLTTDPISAVPKFGFRLSAWLSVHLIASDYTASGVDPEFGVFSYNFPEAMSRHEREEYVIGIGETCSSLGVTIVGGHTGSYPGGGFTVIGSGTMLGLAKEGEYVTPAMAQPDDLIVMTKHAAIEATASLALSFPIFTDANVGKANGGKARSMIQMCSTVKDAKEARKVGLGPDGVSSMHDVTEGGVLGALDEMATASGKSFVVKRKAIPVPAEVARVCSAFNIDPLASMGEGALLITCSPNRAQELLRTLRRSGTPAAEIGVVKKGSGLVLRNGSGRLGLFVPKPDEYWRAYDQSTKQGLK
jgi:hydrogenase maturation factor